MSGDHLLDLHRQFIHDARVWQALGRPRKAADALAWASVVHDEIQRKLHPPADGSGAHALVNPPP